MFCFCLVHRCIVHRYFLLDELLLNFDLVNFCVCFWISELQLDFCRHTEFCTTVTDTAQGLLRHGKEHWTHDASKLGWGANQREPRPKFAQKVRKTPPARQPKSEKSPTLYLPVQNSETSPLVGNLASSVLRGIEVPDAAARWSTRPVSIVISWLICNLWSIHFTTLLKICAFKMWFCDLLHWFL